MKASLIQSPHTRNKRWDASLCGHLEVASSCFSSVPPPLHLAYAAEDTQRETVKLAAWHKTHSQHQDSFTLNPSRGRTQRQAAGEGSTLRDTQRQTQTGCVAGRQNVNSATTALLWKTFALKMKKWRACKGQSEVGNWNLDQKATSP